MLKPPAYAKNAKPTTRGWIDNKTGELLVSRKHSEREVEEYYIAKSQEATPAPKSTPSPIIEADPEPVISETAEVLIEADPADHEHDYTNMTKAQLAEHAALEHGINLDTSMTKAQMIEDFESQI